MSRSRSPHDYDRFFPLHECACGSLAQSKQCRQCQKEVPMPYTPGPWEVATVNAGHSNPSVTSLGIVTEKQRGHSVIIARMPAEYRPTDKIYETATANARLIAAAPELLEALRETLESLRVWQEQYDPDATDEVTDQTIRRGSLAIARAEGGG